MLTSLFALPVNVGSWNTTDFNDIRSEVSVYRSIPSDDNLARVYAGFGLGYTWWKPGNETDDTIWIWGSRGSVGYQRMETGGEEDNPNTELRSASLGVRTELFPIVAEGLVGIAGARIALIAGLGIGIGIVGELAEYDYDIEYYDGREIDGEWDLTVKRPVTPLYSASLSGLFLVGRNWVLEAGLWTNGQFVSAFEEGYVFRGWGERIAVGYRFGGT
jgi:hypothetical protein